MNEKIFIQSVPDHYDIDRCYKWISFMTNKNHTFINSIIWKFHSTTGSIDGMTSNVMCVIEIWIFFWKTKFDENRLAYTMRIVTSTSFYKFLQNKNCRKIKKKIPKIATQQSRKFKNFESLLSCTHLWGKNLGRPRCPSHI